MDGADYDLRRFAALEAALGNGAQVVTCAREVDLPAPAGRLSRRVYVEDPAGEYFIELRAGVLEVGPLLYRPDPLGGDPIPVTEPVARLPWRSLPRSAEAMREALAPHLNNARAACPER